ncbi:hypothetical protein [Chitinophaga ginsengisoli]|uniref:Uncharacterized protein n=1 Tax=Chitinophaga ginsengisoli TaxID=363837 RepID=A0A2P8G2C4_9BACT|nr:hypothetical protein [Chitinophaga ginsengisoli]PSL28111.1 hypothetical protein CLV42_10830 [Chitinophaga ginsengisoli]
MLVTFTLTSIISCSKESQFNAARDYEKEFYDRVSAYADCHDDGLDFVYEQFTASANGRIVNEDFNEFDIILQPPNPNGPPTSAGPVLQYIVQFMKTKLNLNMDSLSKVSPGIIEDSSDFKFFLFDHNRYWISDYMKYVYKRAFSARLATGINNFQLTIENNTDTLKINMEGEDIIKSTLPYLSDTLEKVILVTMIRIGVNSAGYWQRSKIKWENLANGYYGYNARGPGIDWKDVIFSDIIGAGGGAVKGAWVGFTGGTVANPGVGTIGGTAVGGLIGMMGGAVVGSAGGVFWNYVKKAIDWNATNIPIDMQIAGIESGDPYIKLMIAERQLHPLSSLRPLNH